MNHDATLVVLTMTGWLLGRWSMATEMGLPLGDISQHRVAWEKTSMHYDLCCMYHAHFVDGMVEAFFGEGGLHQKVFSDYVTKEI